MPQLTFGTSKKTIEDKVLWSKEKILSQVGQEEIFEHFLKIPVNYRGMFRSPLREDENPTCSFKWISNTLWFRDWSETHAKDCFEIVKETHHCDFYTALEIIAKEFNLTLQTPREGFSASSKLSTENYKRRKNNEKSIIEVKKQRFTSTDVEYLKSYHLTHKIVRAYNVFSVKAFWLNGNRFYVYSKNKPALGYYFGLDDSGRQKWKIYFYKTRDSWRFIGNTNRINGWIQIPEKGKNLIITKSLKDVMCLAKFKIPAIAMQGETQIPYDYIIDELKSRYDNIYTLLDFDRPGIRSSNIIKKLYDIPPLFLTDGSFGSKDYKHKDFSDYLKAEGSDMAAKLIQHAKYKLKYKPKLFFL